jgi:imidazolonepropionase-like amidohydrolase
VVPTRRDNPTLRVLHRTPSRRRALLPALAAAVVVHGARLGAQPAAPATPVALVGGTVVDVERGTLLRDHTVLVAGGRIVAVGPDGRTRVPPGATRVPLRGAYVIPGLWDMHVHMALAPATGSAEIARRDARLRWFATLSLAHGVTGVRDLAGDAAALRAVARGSAPGPRVVFTGQKLGERAVLPGAPFPVRTRDDVRRSVTMLREAGAGLVKLAPMLPADITAHALAECAAQRLPCIAHVPREGLDAMIAHPGTGGFEHLFELPEHTARIPAATLFARHAEAEGASIAQRVLYRLGLRARPRDVTLEAMDAHDPAKAARLYRAIAASGVFVTPTLLLHDLLHRVTPPHPPARDTLLLAEAPTDGLRRERRTAAQRSLVERKWTFLLRQVQAMHDAGVPLLAGTDLPLQGVAGAALHYELMLLQRAGLSPLAALRTATLNPARALAATDSLGAIGPGRVADLVVLRRNPLDDIANVTTVEMVMTRGQLLRRRALDSLVDAGRSAAAQVRR